MKDINSQLSIDIHSHFSASIVSNELYLHLHAFYLNPDYFCMSITFLSWKERNIFIVSTCTTSFPELTDLLIISALISCPQPQWLSCMSYFPTFGSLPLPSLGHFLFYSHICNCNKLRGSQSITTVNAFGKKLQLIQTTREKVRALGV